MKASCGGHRDEDLEHERKRLLKDRAKDEAHYYKNKLSTNQTEAKMASSGQYNIRKLFNAIKTRGRSSGL